MVEPRVPFWITFYRAGIADYRYIDTPKRGTSPNIYLLLRSSFECANSNSEHQLQSTPPGGIPLPDQDMSQSHDMLLTSHEAGNGASGSGYAIGAGAGVMAPALPGSMPPLPAMPPLPGSMAPALPGYQLAVPTHLAAAVQAAPQAVAHAPTTAARAVTAIMPAAAAVPAAVLRGTPV